jgi:V/A-type H+-transporting ATPase subunit K
LFETEQPEDYKIMSVLATTLSVVLANATAAGSAEPAIPPLAGAALAVGLAAFGAGYAERGIGAAAVGAIAEDDDMFGRGLILTVLPETLVILALVVVFLTL